MPWHAVLSVGAFIFSLLAAVVVAIRVGTKRRPSTGFVLGVLTWVLLAEVFGTIFGWKSYVRYPGGVFAFFLLAIVISLVLIAIGRPRPGRQEVFGPFVAVVLFLVVAGYTAAAYADYNEPVKPSTKQVQCKPGEQLHKVNGKVTPDEHGKTCEPAPKAGPPRPATSTTVPKKRKESATDRGARMQAKAAAKAEREGMQAGPQTPSNPHGVDCLDGCVMFGGLSGNNAQEVFADFQAKLTRSPRSVDFAAQAISQCMGVNYTDKRPVNNPDKFVSDLHIVFTFFGGVTKVELVTTPRGTPVWNTVNTPAGLIQFKQVLAKDRETLAMINGSCTFNVFTTCGNGVTPQAVPGIPQTTKPPVQVTFHRKDCPGHDPNPNTDTVLCDPTGGTNANPSSLIHPQLPPTSRHPVDVVGQQSTPTTMSKSGATNTRYGTVTPGGNTTGTGGKDTKTPAKPKTPPQGVTSPDKHPGTPGTTTPPAGTLPPVCTDPRNCGTG